VSDEHRDGIDLPDGALHGVRVLDLGQIYNGSYCGLLLAHLGADVIKVEPPTGESTRWRSANGASKPFLMLNSNKRGLAVDLKQPAGRDILLRLAAGSDVLIENFAAGTMGRLGLGYDTMSKINTRLVYASGKGYSVSGSKRDRPAMDLTVQADTGVLSSTGFPDGPPVKAGVAVADFMGGVHLATAILAALYQRERTGRGQFVEVAMQDAVIPTLASNLAGLLDGAGDIPERTGNRHGSLSMCPYNVYRVADGWIAIFCMRDAHWIALCAAMGRPELASDNRYASQYARAKRMDEVDDLVGSWAAKRPRDECVAELAARGVPTAAVRHLAEVASDPDLFDRGILHRVSYPGVGETVVFGNPLTLSDSPTVIRRLAPTIGEHTTEVLTDMLGLPPAEIDELRSSGAVI
jgi:crotonobetainyl-CoA:carnitine CoA-transferase CaiB-like acyl-CoA transferase